ncbi:MAG: hypothetical protein IPM53_17540 [Anaerolineaceae bacterium]|nr:hypothetical protein [Anaerolineaceae bacterium]
MTAVLVLKLRVAGHVDPRWLDWFEGLAMHHLADGSTELVGTAVDQSALFGLLNRARDLGLTLLSVAVETAEQGEKGG